MRQRARYGYTGLGDANQLLDDATGQSQWTANTADAELHLTQQTAGNGLVTTDGFDPLTGRLTGTATGSGSAVQNLSYTYDRRGNPLSRSDANTGLSEAFTYDSLNRLTSSTVNSTLSKSFSYDPTGNLLSKSDVGSYTYPAAGQPQPLAVSAIGGGAISTTFSYDLNGNQTSGLGRSIVYTSSATNALPNCSDGAGSNCGNGSLLHVGFKRNYSQVSQLSEGHSAGAGDAWSLERHTRESARSPAAGWCRVGAEDYAYLRSDVIGPRGHLFRDSIVTALYVSVLVYFPEQFRRLRTRLAR